MTKITKPVTRMSDALIRDGGKLRRLVVTIFPNDTLGIRPEKTRRGERISLEAVYGMAVKIRIRDEKNEKAKQKVRRK